MKRLFTLVALTLALTGAKADVVINATNFPDENFRAQVAEYDTDGDGVLSDEEMETGFFGLVNFGYNVTNFKGIELLTKLTDVSIGYSSLEDPSLTSFDYALPNLTWIEFHDAGNLTTIDLSKCPKLEVFQANGVPKLSTLNVPTGITSFSLGNAPLIKTFDPKQFQKLHTFVLTGNTGITDVDFTNHSKIQIITVEGGEDKYQLNSLVMSNCQSLANIDIKHATIKSLTFKSLPEMLSILVYESDITSMLVEDLPQLQSIEGHNNDLGTMTLKKLPVIGGLDCNDNRLQTLLIDDCPNFTSIYAENNRLMWLDLSGVKKGGAETANYLTIDNQRPDVVAVKISPTETGLRVHDRFDVARVLNLRAKGIAQTPKEIFVDDIRYFVFYDNGPDTPNLVGSDCYYEYETKWPYPWAEGNTKDNNLPVTLNVYSWTKHPSFIKLSTNDIIRGEYGQPAPEAPAVTRSQDYDGKLTWKSSNENVVTVNADTGELTVIGAGTAIITISGAETDYRLAPASISYTVVIDKATPTFSFEKAELSVKLGEAVPQNPLSIGLYDGTVAYASSNQEIATVTSEGVVTALAIGEVIISATGAETQNCYEARSAQYMLKVGESSGISAVITDAKTGKVYDLQGRQIKGFKNRKGIYVVDGKKVIK